MQCKPEGCTVHMGKDTLPEYLPQYCQWLLKQEDIGTIQLSGSAPVTACPNSCARERPFPTNHCLRSPALAKPEAGESCVVHATWSQGGCDTEGSSWGPQLLIS